MGRATEFMVEYVFFGPWTWLFKTLDTLVPKDKSIVIFGSNGGKNYSDNSKSLFEYVINNSKIIKPFWITKNKSVYSKLKKQYHGKVIKSLSFKGIWTYLRAEQIIISHSYLDMSLLPWTGKKTVNYLWHGIPIKKIGNYIEESNEIGGRKSPHWRRWNKNIDYFFAGSEYEAKIMKKAFSENISINITGNPRNDELFNMKKEDNDGINTILYAPTWRFGDGLKQAPNTPLLHPKISEEEIHRFLYENNLKLIIRPHPLAEKMDFNSNLIQCVTINDESELYSLFKISDVLITDYSSAYFDWLILKKPVIFSCYDIEEYAEKFGFIDNLDTIYAGPICTEPEELKSELKNIISGKSDYEEKLDRISSEIFGNYRGKSRYKIMKILEDRINLIE